MELHVIAVLAERAVGPSTSMSFPRLTPSAVEPNWFPRLEVDDIDLLAQLEADIQTRLHELQHSAAPTPIGTPSRPEDDDDATAEDEEEEEEDDEYDDEELELADDSGTET